MKFKKVIISIISLVFLYSCGLEGLKVKKRSENSDEFLVEKKNPLTEPPDMNELPVPLDHEEEKSKTNSEDTLDIEKVLNSEKSEDSNTQNEESSLEKTILEKINN